jgi:hypothetical protein
LASLAQRHEELLEAGFRVVAIDIDSPEQHAAMVEKLHLPFPMLSDPDRSQAIIPCGLADNRDPRGLARPALVGIEPGGLEVFRFVARDYADRLPEDDLLSALQAQGLPPTIQPRPTPGSPQPGPRAMPRRAMIPYFRGSRFAALALSLRHGHKGGDLMADAKAFIAEMDRFVDAIKDLPSSR